MNKNIFFTLCLLCLFISCKKNPVTEWVTSTPEKSWVPRNINEVKLVNTDAFDAEIDISNPQQTIDGFGTCFNELGWTSLSALSDADRESVLKELFEPGTGANFTVCRMPVGANDFSRNWYSYNETEGDFEMRNFSISNDRETLIPFIKNAQKYNPNLKLWASPWCPPSWMKYNKHYACRPSKVNDLTPEQRGAEGTNMFIQEDAYFKAYALYFAKFIEAYRNENIPVFMIMPQNEFNSCQVFPSCTWTASGLNKFIGEYLGPKMKEIGVDVMLGTIERANALLADTVLKDEKSSKYIKGAGFQWSGKGAIETVHKNYPSLKIYQTEQECGNGKNDWALCLSSWKLLKHYLNNGANVYDYWNTSLEEGGVSRWGWRQNSLVTVNKDAKTYKFNYEYYLLKHVSHYVLAGAQRLPLSGTFTNMLAFKNVDNSYVIVIQNDQKEKISPVIKIGDRLISATLEPDSFNTIVLK